MLDDNRDEWGWLGMTVILTVCMYAICILSSSNCDRNDNHVRNTISYDSWWQLWLQRDAYSTISFLGSRSMTWMRNIALHVLNDLTISTRISYAFLKCHKYKRIMSALKQNSCKTHVGVWKVHAHKALDSVIHPPQQYYRALSAACSV